MTRDNSMFLSSIILVQTEVIYTVLYTRFKFTAIPISYGFYVKDFIKELKNLATERKQANFLALDNMENEDVSRTIPLLEHSSYTDDARSEDSIEMGPTVRFEPHKNNNYLNSENLSERSRKGTNPYSADLKYRNMITSRHPKEPTDLPGIITSDNIEQLKKLLSEKSDREKARLLVRPITRVDKTCIQMAVEFRSLACLQYFIDLYSSLDKEFQNIGVDVSESFYTSRGESVFHTLAARSFDLQILDILATNDKAKVMINSLDREGNSPLLISTKRRNFEMSEYLANHGAKIDSMNKCGESPLSICIENKEIRLLECFLKNVDENRLADLVQNYDLYEGHTILYPLLGSETGFCRCYSVLAKNIPEILLLKCFRHEIQNIEFLKKCCCCCRDHNAIDKIMELKSDFVLVKDDNGVTPLMWASANGNALLLSKILSSASWKEAILARDIDEKSFIHHGVQYNCLNLITQENLERLTSAEEFIELLNQEDIRGYTALHYAVTEGNSEAFSTLTTLGASHRVLGPAPYRRSLLHYAVYSDKKTVDGLLQSVRNTHGNEAMMTLINEGDFRKETAVHLAARSGRTEIVFYLLSKHASFKSDYKDRTPLHSAAEGGSTDVISTLLEFKPEIIDAKDHQDRTALMVASEKGHADAVKLLLSNQAMITKDVNGNSCLDYAVDNNWPATALVIIGSDLWRKALKQSHNGYRNIMSKMVDKMDNVACNVLDKCIIYEVDKNSEENKITYDFFLLKKSSTVGISPFLKSMVDCKSYTCLNHPVVKKFLTLSWRSPRVRGMYFASLFVYLLFLLSFTAYIWNTRDGSNNWKSPKLLVLTTICVAISIMSLLIEIVQFVKGKLRYLKEGTNYLELILYASTMIFFLPAWRDKTPVQWRACSIGIFLAWIRFIWFLKFFSSFGVYIIMAKRVFLTVLKVFPLILPFLIAFGMSFFVLFPKDDGFSNIPLSIFHTLVMMNGEFSFRDTFVEKDNAYPVLQYITLLLFFLLISIAIMNLFTGLAVGDTSEVISHSEDERRWQQADYILALERLSPCVRYPALTSHTDYPKGQKSDEIEYSEAEGLSGKPRKRYSSMFQDMKQWLTPEDKPDGIQGQGTHTDVDKRISYVVQENVQPENNSEIIEELLNRSRTLETFMFEMKESMDILNVCVQHLETRLEEPKEKSAKNNKKKN